MCGRIAMKNLPRSDLQDVSTYSLRNVAVTTVAKSQATRLLA
jgi:hypothetical protein